MQNYKAVRTQNGVELAKTAEPANWKPGKTLWDHIFDIKMLEQEFARIKQADQGRFNEETAEYLDDVNYAAWDIYKCCDTYVERQRAAHVYRESDRIQAEWLHHFEIEDGLAPPGTRFNEEEWSKRVERMLMAVAVELRK